MGEVLQRTQLEIDAKKNYQIVSDLAKFFEEVSMVESLDLPLGFTMRMRQELFSSYFHRLPDVRAIQFIDNIVQFKTFKDAHEPDTQIWPIWALDLFGKVTAENMGYEWTPRFLPPDVD